MKNWVRWLPLALVERLARSKCETVLYGGSRWHIAFQDVLIREKP